MAGWRSRTMSLLSVLAAVGAVGATLAFAHDVAKKSLTTPLPSKPIVAPVNPLPSASVVAPARSPYPTDARGFVDTAARCEGALTGVAFVRTQGSLVAICTDPDGGYRYHGVRLRDGARLTVAADAGAAREFVAHNEGVTYALSPTELVIAEGGTVIRRESVLESREAGR